MEAGWNLSPFFTVTESQTLRIVLLCIPELRWCEAGFLLEFSAEAVRRIIADHSTDLINWHIRRKQQFLCALQPHFPNVFRKTYAHLFLEQRTHMGRAHMVCLCNGRN